MGGVALGFIKREPHAGQRWVRVTVDVATGGVQAVVTLLLLSGIDESAEHLFIFAARRRIA